MTGEELVGARGYGGASSLLSVQLGANRGEMEAGLCPGRGEEKCACTLSKGEASAKWRREEEVR